MKRLRQVEKVNSVNEEGNTGNSSSLEKRMKGRKDNGKYLNGP